MSKDTRRPAPELPAVWPPAPLGTLPVPSLPPRRRTLLGSAGLDAALGIPLGLAAGMLSALAMGQGPMACAGGGMVWPAIAVLVNLAISLAVGRRFRAFGAGMGAASLVTILALGWCVWRLMAPWCGDGLSGGDGTEQGAGE